MKTAKIVNVIEILDGETREFFTLDGMMIGSFVGGKRTSPEVQTIEVPINSAILTSPSPKTVKARQEMERNSED